MDGHPTGPVDGDAVNRWLLVDGRPICELTVASSWSQRSRGLLGRDGIDGALWLSRTSSVHTVGMRFAIDVVHCDRVGRVLGVVTQRPGRLGAPRWRARHVVELEAGRAAELGITPGRILSVGGRADGAVFIGCAAMSDSSTPNATTAGPLSGLAALITGGGSGIGLAAAVALAVDGAAVTLMGRSADKLEAGAAAVRAAAPHATVQTISGDVTDEDSVAAAVALAGEPLGGLHLCVAAAGDGTMGPVIAMPLEEWNRVLGVSLTGVFLTLKHAGAAISASGGGSIVAVSSIASKITHRFMAPYCVAKAGVDMLVRTTADELGQANVRVNAVNPGIVRTDMVAMITAEDSVGQSYLENSPISRFSEVSDVAPAIRYLCGPESAMVTGQCLSIDGGHHLRRGPDFGEWTAAMYGVAAEGRLA